MCVPSVAGVCPRGCWHLALEGGGWGGGISGDWVGCFGLGTGFAKNWWVGGFAFQRRSCSSEYVAVSSGAGCGNANWIRRGGPELSWLS